MDKWWEEEQKGNSIWCHCGEIERTKKKMKIKLEIRRGKGKEKETVERKERQIKDTRVVISSEAIKSTRIMVLDPTFGHGERKNKCRVGTMEAMVRRFHTSSHHLYPVVEKEIALILMSVLRVIVQKKDQTTNRVIKVPLEMPPNSC